MKARIRDRMASLFSSAVQAVNPYDLVRSHFFPVMAEYTAGPFERLFVVGFGKASSAMARAVEDVITGLISEGIVVTKYGHTQEMMPEKILVREAGHPLPDENGVRASNEVIGLLKRADKQTLILCLISGGGSALLVSPWEGITLGEKRTITGLLLKSGADINDLNAVRKHISRVKGGRLAEIAYPARLVSLILSDVIRDKLDVIASGPTAPDRATYRDALMVLEKYGLLERTPKSIVELLRDGREGLVAETPKEGDPVFQRVENRIIGNNRAALSAARKKAEEELGFESTILAEDLTGEARDTGKWLARKAIELKRSRVSGRPFCLLSGGETTVTVRGGGTGGRNTELALSFAIEVEGTEGITLLSAGTDGTDGPTDAAGAIVDGGSCTRARAMGLDPKQFLTNNDSYTFFKRTGDLFVTGPTGTNVMDIQVTVVE